MRTFWVLGGAVLVAGASLTFALPAQASDVVNPARCAAQGGLYSENADGSVRSCAAAGTATTVVSRASEFTPISIADGYYVSRFDVIATPVTTTTTTAGAK
jgi:hypothetical protein